MDGLISLRGVIARYGKAESDHLWVKASCWKKYSAVETKVKRS